MAYVKGLRKAILYRVTIQLVANLPLTSEQKFRFGLARPGQAKAELLFRSLREVRHKLNGHPVYGLICDISYNRHKTVCNLGIKVDGETWPYKL